MFSTILVIYCLIQSIASQSSGSPLVLQNQPPNDAVAVPEAFVSFSIEFAFFPDFAGNKSLPNIFSNNLLNNLGKLQGTKPYLRVGGNTQDYALYNASLKTSTYGIINPNRSPDYPTTLFIGPSYFESYKTFPDTKFIHGFNLGLGGNNTAGWETLLATVPLACKAIGDNLLWWEYGNEPDLFSTSSQGPVRPPSWDEATYVSQWLNGTRAIRGELAKACPELNTAERYGYLAPSFAGSGNRLKNLKTWNLGINADNDIKLFSIHNYIGGATQKGVTLQGTLMNHTRTVLSVSSLTTVRDSLQNSNYPPPPFIVGETNSLYNQGAPGLSNAFGAALWGVDFNLWCASQGIKRVHMHQGTDYRYAAWQPISTKLATKGTKAPYYGSIGVASFLGNLGKGVKIVNIPLSHSYEAAYAAYVDDKLKRIMVINLREYNYTVNGTSSVVNPVKRPELVYNLAPPSGYNRVIVQRLIANGSDAITGISFAGHTYNYEVANGKPVRLQNVTASEKAAVRNGLVSLVVPDSSAAVLEF